jgi:hypothetical protein
MVTSGPTCRPDTNESLALAYRRHNLQLGGQDPEAEHQTEAPSWRITPTGLLGLNDLEFHHGVPDQPKHAVGDTGLEPVDSAV